ncbi:MAG: class I SAM-dependent RNA methyltransferase, partial [Anaerolineales bacterium]|nr:class I SAM-dependent RNA methyltransferase [Anaerolineales bacterium]
MDPITLIAITKQGLEGVVAQEVAALGLEPRTVSRGSVEFAAALADVPRANLWLRCADRVLLQVGAFRAVTFDELFEQTKALPWEQWIPRDGVFPVSGKSVQSTLQSVRSSQAIVKKAIAERLMAAYGESWLPETGASFAIQVALLRDVATLTLDTSGEGLHRRGYRTEAGEAPLKESFAAGLVQLSQWRPELPLVDPLCGAGTILIEAALLARGRA